LEYLPAGQSIHVLSEEAEVAVEYVPALQLVQTKSVEFFK
jgi:hypothetical protein